MVLIAFGMVISLSFPRDCGKNTMNAWAVSPTSRFVVQCSRFRDAVCIKRQMFEGGGVVSCHAICSIDNSPTNAEKVETHALRETKDSNSGWLENLNRRAHEVTIAIVPVELIGAVFLCGRP